MKLKQLVVLPFSPAKSLARASLDSSDLLSGAAVLILY